MNFVKYTNCCSLFLVLVVCLSFSSLVNCQDQVECGILPSITNGKLKEEKNPPYHPGTKIGIQCNAGYITRGHTLEIECTARDGGAEWVLPERQCIPKSCSYPGDVENADRAGDVFTFSRTVNYTCKEGYKMKGSATIYCMAKGGWNPSLPSCEAIICPPIPGDIQNGQVHSSNRKYGGKVMYECDDGFILEGPRERTCGNEAKWSGNTPTCKAIICPPPPDIQNGQVHSPDGKYGDKATYECDDGFVLEGPRERTCGNEAKWSGNAPTCRSTATPTVPVSTTEVSNTSSSGHVKEAASFAQYIAPSPVTEVSDTNSPVTEVSDTNSPVTEVSDTISPVTEVSDTISSLTEISPVTEVSDTISPVTEINTNLSGLQNGIFQFC